MASNTLPIDVFIVKRTAHVRIGSTIITHTLEKCCEDVFPMLIENLQVQITRCRKGLEECRRKYRDSNYRDSRLLDLIHFLTNEIMLYGRSLGIYKLVRENTIKYMREQRRLEH